MKEKRYVGMEIRALDNLIRRFIDSKMRDTKLDHITGSNGWIIGYLKNNLHRPVYQKDLEAEFHITRSTTSKVLNLMEEKGLIVRESVAKDARLKRLVLTPKAIKISKELEEKKGKLEAQIVKGFTEDELEQLYSYIDRIKKNVKVV